MSTPVKSSTEYLFLSALGSEESVCIKLRRAPGMQEAPSGGQLLLSSLPLWGPSLVPVDSVGPGVPATSSSLTPFMGASQTA